jgi:DNA polymerase IV
MQAMILHVDMDAFYASVEERDDPSLVGKPVVVGGTAEGRGVVAAANYEARKYGIHSAMAAATAVRLCPQAVFIRPRMDRYADESRRIRAIFEEFTPLVEPLSLDEAFLDVTGSEPLFGPAAEIGWQIKRRIRNELGLVASVGVATTKFLAKIASDFHKPDGFLAVESGQEQLFLDPLPVGRIWGVGKVTGLTFARLGIRTIGDLRKLSLNAVSQLFGASGQHYWELAQGIDPRRVVPDREAKSISHETTFAEDIGDREVLLAIMRELAEQVGRRLRRHQLKGHTIELKLRSADFRTITRSITLPEPSNITHELIQAGSRLLRERVPDSHLPLRLLGFGVKGFDDSGRSQRQLFDESQRERQRQLDTVADRIVGKYGKGAIQRGRGRDADR